jgi:hypothetical protein
MKNKKMVITSIVVIVIVGVGAFLGGTLYAKGKSPESRSMGNRGGQFSNIRGDRAGDMNVRGMGGFTGGEIISKDEKSITVKLMDGGSKIIFLGSTTKVSKSVDGSTEDLVVGKQVTITGTPNADGSLTAQSVQLRPNMPITSPNIKP